MDYSTRKMVNFGFFPFEARLNLQMHLFDPQDKLTSLIKV